MKTYSRKKSEETGEVIINLNELCRLCLTRSDELVHIFNDEEPIPLPLRIMACVALEVVEDDGLPNMICIACKYQLEKSYVFRKKCESSDHRLRRHLKLISSSNKLLEDEDEIEGQDLVQESALIKQCDKTLSDKSQQVKKLLADILEDETNEDGNIQTLEQTTTESELLGATITYLAQPDAELYEDPDNITLPLEMEEANKDACTLKTELKNEIIDMEPAEQELDMSQVYYVDVDPSSETTDSQNSQNYEAIAELVKSTLSTQPGFSGELHLKLQPKRETTQVQVTTDDGSVMVMELLTEEDVPTISQQIQQDDDGELKIWQCPNCPKAFARRIQLNRHSSVHMQQRGFTCNVCEKWFPTRSALVRHERIHTGEKPFECGICKRCFAQKEVLFRHLMTHSGEKPYQCTHCDKGFTQREALRSHMRQHIKPNPADIQLHRCSLCPKMFCHASGLSRHLLTHTGKTFKCRDCDKSFSDKSSLRRHHRLMFHQA